MITLTGTVNSQLPKVSNIKALDIYFGMCFFYVFAALIEFACLCYLDKKGQKMAERQKEEENTRKLREEQQMKTFALLREVDYLTASPEMPTGGLQSSVGTFDDNNVLPFQHNQSSVGLGQQSMEKDCVAYFAPSSPAKRVKMVPQNSLGSSMNAKRNDTSNPFASRATKPKPPFNVLHVDNYARVLFPTTFMILNLIYWGFYTNVMKLNS